MANSENEQIILSAVINESIPLCATPNDSSADPVDGTDFCFLCKQETNKRISLTKLAHKAARDYDDLNLRYREVSSMVDILQQKLSDSESQLTNLRKVSEAVYHEYDYLKRRYDVEHNTMSQAFSKATEWYKENKSLRRETEVLRRQSAMFMQKIPLEEADLEFDLAKLEKIPENESIINLDVDDQFIGELLQKVKDLEAEIMGHAAELAKTKVDEFEAQEQIIDMRKQLEESESKVAELKVRHDHAVLSRQNAMVCLDFGIENDYKKALEEIKELNGQLKQNKETNIIASQNTEDHIILNEEGRNDYQLLKQKCFFLEEGNNNYKNKESKYVDLLIKHEQLKLELKEITDLVIDNGESVLGCQKNSRIQIPPLPSPKPVNPPQIPMHFQLKTHPTIPPPPPPPPKVSVASSIPTHPPPPQLLIPLPPPPMVSVVSSIPTAPLSPQLMMPTPNSSPPPPPPPPSSPSSPLSSPPPPPPPPPVVKLSAVNMLGSIIGVSKRKLPETEIIKAPVMDDLIDQIKRGGIQLKKTPRSEVKRRIRPLDSSPNLKVDKVHETEAINEMNNILATMKKSRLNKTTPILKNAYPKPDSLLHNSRFLAAPNTPKNTKSLPTTPVLQKTLKPFRGVGENQNSEMYSSNKTLFSSKNINKNSDVIHIGPSYGSKNEPVNGKTIESNNIDANKSMNVSSTTIFLSTPNNEKSVSNI